MKRTVDPSRAALMERVRQLPLTPGVYLFKDRRGRILYIGRATRLRQRVLSYFTGRDERPLIPFLLREAYDIDVLTTKTPFEALILEAQLIRRHHPRYNTLLKDTRGHPYVRIDPRERFPAVEIVFRTQDDGARYFGPFRSIGHARKVLDMVYRFFRIRQCDLDLNGEQRYPVCLLYHIARCSGPCAGHISPELYRADVEAAMALLDGDRGAVLERLESMMKAHARAMNFEAAARYRDAIRTLENWDPHPTVVDEKRRNLDVFGIARKDQQFALVILQIRQGRLVRKRELLLEAVDLKKEDDPEWWERVLPQYYLTVQDPPEAVWLPVVIKRKRILERWFRYHFKRRIRLVSPENLATDDTRILEWAAQNAGVILATYGVSALDDPARILRWVQSALNLPTYPYRVEGYDVSNIQGKWNVASMVVFERGVPKRRAYRRFRIRTVIGPDDYACLREALYRRFRGRLAVHTPRPDLILIDGGPGQLNAALEGMKAAGVSDIPVIALAKREELIYRKGTSEPLRLDRTSPILRWLQQIRDEAHRTAITFYRRLHREDLRRWSLTEVPGIGPKLAWRLLQRFSGWRELRGASFEAIAEVVGPRRARALQAWLKGEHGRADEIGEGES